MSSPHMALDSVFITSATETAEGRWVAVMDIHGVYLSAGMDDKEETLIVLWGPMADLMVLAAPEVYPKFAMIVTLGQKLL